MTDTNADMDVKPDEQAVAPTVVEKRDDGIVRPGDLSAKLQACRERADLDQDQAGIAMRLSPAMIKALETENFAELPDPPYVRGYLRSYARLDESDPQDLIRTYELLRGADPDSLTTPPPISLTRVQHKQGISPTTIRMLGLVALVLLLGVLSMIPGINQWVRQTWQSFAAAQPGSVPTMASKPAPITNTTTPEPGTSTDLTASGPVPTISSPALATTAQDSPAPVNSSEAVQPSTTPPSTDPAASTTTSTTASSNPSAPTTLALATPAATAPTINPATPTGTETTAVSTSTATTPTATNPTTTAGTTPETTPTTSITPAPTPTNGATSTVVTATTPAVGTNPTPTTDPAVATPAAVDPNKPAEATATTQQPIDGEVLVRMEFTQEVWMQIRDGGNKAIFESLNSPNTWKQFKTRTPLTFKIGNAPGVKLYLNGQAYDHAKYTRGSVARFTVN
ncbi:helix-turn-helix domain-containing protein [uncultured Thiothrix sp.]|uniref:helix-turn-helix domain-containing protein n=1 Tax=uncultured Thiothrix sp. TaxID=223185 RepID=UPI00261A6B87|nr:helix-turn-helix domain-containing protein [uncultured Thiothrix sp.]